MYVADVEYKAIGWLVLEGHQVSTKKVSLIPQKRPTIVTAVTPNEANTVGVKVG